MTLPHINKKLATDKTHERNQKRIYSKIGIERDTSTGQISFDFSYLKENRIQGQFVKKLQGDHTTAYSVIISALEQRLSRKTPTEILAEIAFDSTKPAPTIHNDLLILFHLYSKIMGHGSDHYLREKLQNAQTAYKKLVSGIYELQYTDEKETDFKVSGEGADQFLKLVTSYLYHYLVCLQYFPFSAVYVEPGQGSGGRGEGTALQFLNRLNTCSETDCIGFFSKFFDERAIASLVKNFSHGCTEIIAFQLMGLLSVLEGYPSAKKFFFYNAQLSVSYAKLKNIAYVIFCYWKKTENATPLSTQQTLDVDTTRKALELIARLRSRLLDYDFFL